MVMIVVGVLMIIKLQVLAKMGSVFYSICMPVAAVLAVSGLGIGFRKEWARLVGSFALIATGLACLTFVIIHLSNHPKLNPAGVVVVVSLPILAVFKQVLCCVTAPSTFSLRWELLAIVLCCLLLRSTTASWFSTTRPRTLWMCSPTLAVSSMMG